MLILTILLWSLFVQLQAKQPFYERTHQSKVFGGPRHYRILLPSDYETSGLAYPVVYYFHGHSDRYTLEKYDDGKDTLPRIAAFVASHPLIVVTVDGYVARDYTGFYGGSPWDVRQEGGDYDFGLYFHELVAHIDSQYRTLTDRRHRAVSGLSMGGFMSLYLSARYPDLVGSASAFNPGPEFYVGEKARRVLWRPKDHVGNHEQSMIRLVRASGDYISQYHEQTRDAYARNEAVDFEYRQDEYHRHWATSIEETFTFHTRAFGNPKLNNAPDFWSHDNPYRTFDVWGYHVESSDPGASIVSLQDVNQGGLRVTTRRWPADGPPCAGCTIKITTAPHYNPGEVYQVIDYALWSGSVRRSEVRAASDGKITFTVDGAGHQVSLAGPGTGAEPPLILPLTRGDLLRVPAGADVPLPIRLYNPRARAMDNITAALSSDYPTVQLSGPPVKIDRLESGSVVDLSKSISARFVAGNGYFAPARVRLLLTYDGWHEVSHSIDLLIIPENVPAANAIEVMDGRTMTLKVFRQKGNQGGGESVDRTIIEGKGNGNGVIEPGEEATIWVRLPQGMDPFDKNNWYRCKVYSDSPWLTEAGNLEESKQREWTSGQERTSVIRLSSATPSGSSIPLLLDNESWSFHYTPDVRYGREKLYQAFQLHTRHLHQFVLKTR